MEIQYKTHRVLEFVLLVIILAGIFESNSRADEDTKYLKAVREFADNVLKYGRDTYGPKRTPLFVDGLNIHTHEPVKWRYKGQVWILSNLASQQNLLRVLDGLTKTTGDPKYRQAAVEAIRYAYDNLRTPNGLLYWGHSMSYDALGDAPCGGSLRCHGMKLNHPYYELMWEVDRTATQRLIESFWAGCVLDWSNLSITKMGELEKQVEPGWSQEYRPRPVFFQGGVSEYCMASSLFYAGALLSRLSGEEDPLIWSKRLAHRYVQTRDLNTGISAYKYSLEQEESTQLTEDLNKHWFLIFPVMSFLDSPMASLWQCGPQLCQLSVGEMLDDNGREFTEWALEELTAWAKASYCKQDNTFVPMLIDGTLLEGKTIVHERTRKMLKPCPAGPIEFWTYALASRLTDDNGLIWETTRSIALGNHWGDIGTSLVDQPDVNMATECSDPYVLIGFLELHKKTENVAFLKMAEKIGDNILASRLNKGFFLPSKTLTFSRFDDVEPLALLHLYGAIQGKKLPIPAIRPTWTYFRCEHDDTEKRLPLPSDSGSRTQDDELIYVRHLY